MNLPEIQLKNLSINTPKTSCELSGLNNMHRKESALCTPANILSYSPKYLSFLWQAHHQHIRCEFPTLQSTAWLRLPSQNFSTTLTSLLQTSYFLAVQWLNIQFLVENQQISTNLCRSQLERVLRKIHSVCTMATITLSMS